MEKSFSSTDDFRGPLSSSIMNYYKKFGQNRDLEKYFRTHHHHHNKSDEEHHHHHDHHPLHSTGHKSSSEGSLFCTATDGGCNLPISEETFMRSLQNISTIKDFSMNKSNLTGESSTKTSARSGYKSDNDGKESSGNEAEGIKTTISSKETSNPKKGVNVNFESFIEINMPEHTSQNYSIPVPIPPPIPPIPSQIPILSSEKMVQTFEDKESQIEIPIIPTKVQNSNPQPPSLESDLNLSPTSSIASQQKQKLEWDSMADVGYSKKQLNSGIEAGLNTLEQNALRKFFANYGLNSDANIILLSSKKCPDEQKKEIVEIPITDSKKKEIRQKWKNISARIIKEVKETKADKTRSIIHSTPVLTKVPSIKEIIELSRIEKCCQTSYIELKSQSVQVSGTSSNVGSSSKSSEKNKSDERSPSINNNSLGKYENEELSSKETPQISKSNPDEETDAESFEFLSGIDYLKKSDQSKTPPVSSTVSSSHFDFTEFDKNPIFQKLSKLEKNLTVGVNLINSLLESKSLSTDSKTVLIKKITSKLEKYIKKDCGDDAGEIITQHLRKHQKKVSPENREKNNKTPLVSQTSSKTSEKEPIQQPQPIRRSSKNSTKGEWLQPMTNSEMEYELYSKSRPVSTTSHHSENTSKRNVDANQIVSAKSEKNLQLSLIDANIKYLEKLKFFLENGGKVDKFLGNPVICPESAKTVISHDLSQPSSIKHMKDMLHNEKKLSSKSSKASSENFKPLPGPSKEPSVFSKTPSASSKSASSKLPSGSGEPPTASSKVPSENSKSPPASSKTHTESSKSNLASSKHNLESHKSHPIAEKDLKLDYKTEKFQSEQSISWNSHAHLKKSTRSKLETPTTMNNSNESINTFARNKKEEFLERYGKIKTRNREQLNIHDYYSNPNKPIVQGKSTSNKNTTSMLSSSDLFSTSLSMPSHSKSSTPGMSALPQKYHHEPFLNIGTQTSDSLRLTTPIQLTGGRDNFISQKLHHTKLVTKVNKNKGNQITPRPISYTITFNENKKIIDINRNIENEKSENEEIEVIKPAVGYLNKQNIIQNNLNLDINKLNFVKRDFDVFSLQSYLIEKKPDFIVRAEERRNYITNVNEKRKIRNEQREKILNLDPNISIKSKLENLPKTQYPHKLFSTNEIKKQTKKKYRQLPEVKKQKEILKENQMKRNNKRIMELFNKNLQKQVLKGKVSLSNSLVLI